MLALVAMLPVVPGAQRFARLFPQSPPALVSRPAAMIGITQGSVPCKRIQFAID